MNLHKLCTLETAGIDVDEFDEFSEAMTNGIKIN